MEVAFGVAGLAGQVIDTSFKIKRIVSTFQSAGEEIENIRFKLDIAANTCKYVRDFIESKRHPGAEPGFLEEHGPRIMAEIMKTLQKLEKALPREDIGRKSRKTRQGIHFLKKGDDIQSLQKQLHDQLSMLNSVILIATSFDQNRIVNQETLKDLETHDTQLESYPIEETFYSGGEAKIVAPCPPPKATRVLLESAARETTWYLGIRSVFEKRKVTKKSRWKNTEETTTVTETNSFSIRHKSSAYAVQVMWWLAGTLSITCSLSLPHIIESSTHKYKHIKWTLYRYCYGGSVRGLQEMFSAGLVTPTTLIDGATLFEWAASFPQPDMCRFILQQNSKLVADEYLLGSKSHPGRNSADARGTSDEVSQSYDDLVGICLATEVPTVVQYRFLISSMCHPRDMLMCFERFQYQVFPDDWFDFIEAAWDEAVLLFIKDIDCDSQWTPAGEMYEDWFPLFGRIVEGGVDISKHVSNKRGGRTALWEILHVTSCPFNLEVALSQWRYILWACGVDIDEYLKREWAVSDIMWDPREEQQKYFAWPRELVSRTIGGRHVFPAWVRRVDPGKGGRALEARREFKDFGPHKPYYEGPSIMFLEHLAEAEEGARHRIWKAFERWSAEPAGREEAWPFGFSPTRDSGEHHPRWYESYDSKEKAIMAQRSFSYALELVKTRFERRQRKKLYKTGYLRRYRRLHNLPGAWNEDLL